MKNNFNYFNYQGAAVLTNDIKETQTLIAEIQIKLNELKARDETLQKQFQEVNSLIYIFSLKRLTFCRLKFENLKVIISFSNTKRKLKRISLTLF